MSRSAGPWAPTTTCLLVNHEYRRKKDGARGDDKLYVWVQVTF